MANVLVQPLRKRVGEPDAAPVRPFWKETSPPCVMAWTTRPAALVRFITPALVSLKAWDMAAAPLQPRTMMFGLLEAPPLWVYETMRFPLIVSPALLTGV